MNAIQHGFSAQHLFVPEDQHDEFEELRGGLIEELEPEGALERIAFNRLIHATWNLHRLAIAENEIFATEPDPLGDEAVAAKLDRLARYQARHERSYQRAIKELQRLQTERTIKESIPDDVAVAPLAETQEVHLAKRNQRKCWPGPIEMQMEAMEADFQRAKAAAEGRP